MFCQKRSLVIGCDAPPKKVLSSFAALAMILLIGLVMMPKTAGAEVSSQLENDSERSSFRTTIWDRPVGELGETYSDVTLLKGTDGLAETAVLPLPAPFLLTGAGLLMVFAIRAKSSRR